jgi:hypothetical protein
MGALKLLDVMIIGGYTAPRLVQLASGSELILHLVEEV